MRFSVDTKRWSLSFTTGQKDAAAKADPPHTEDMPAVITEIAYEPDRGVGFRTGRGTV